MCNILGHDCKKFLQLWKTLNKAHMSKQVSTSKPYWKPLTIVYPIARIPQLQMISIHICFFFLKTIYFLLLSQLAYCHTYFRGIYTNYEACISFIFSIYVKRHILYESLHVKLWQNGRGDSEVKIILFFFSSNPFSRAFILL